VGTGLSGTGLSQDAEVNGYKWGQWSLPTFGALVGFGTNWIALKMIFEPTFPVKVDRLPSPFGRHSLRVAVQRARPLRVCRVVSCRALSADQCRSAAARCKGSS
jgi:hypothetical protein